MTWRVSRKRSIFQQYFNWLRLHFRRNFFPVHVPLGRSSRKKTLYCPLNGIRKDMLECHLKHPPPPLPTPAQHPLEFVTGNADTVTVSIHYFRIARNTPCLRPVTAPPSPPYTHTNNSYAIFFRWGWVGNELLKYWPFSWYASRHWSAYATTILCSDQLVFISEESELWVNQRKIYSLQSTGSKMNR